MASLRIEELDESNIQDWEDFNNSNKQGSFFHTLKWRDVLESSFSYKARYFMIYHHDDPIALCPFFEGLDRKVRIMISLPDSDMRHIISDCPKDRRVACLMLEKVTHMCKDRRIAYSLLSFPSTEPLDAMVCTGQFNAPRIYRQPISGNMILDLSDKKPEDIWNNIFTSKDSQRKFINRFERMDYKVVEVDPSDGLNDFYKYYCQNLNHIGAVPYDRKHFEELFEKFNSEECRMTVLKRDDHVAGGLVSFFFRPTQTVYFRYLAINRDIPKTFHPPYPVFWEGINHAHQKGFNSICFGGSPKNPQDRSYAIKKSFGCHFEPVHTAIVPMNRFVGTLYRIYRWKRGYDKKVDI